MSLSGEVIGKIRKGFVAAFSESDGKPSFSRIASAVVLFCAICWITFVVIKKYAIPELGGIAALIGTLYGANQLGNLLAKKDEKKED